ncbi:MAG: glutathione S-transferase family protein [Rhodospirillales bacterium]|nr:glutathione S-transferase family protein [Rhodospirillales bacterium]
MATVHLTIGNRRYSSWSLRGWLAIRLAGLEPDTDVIWLDEPGYKERLAAASPGRTVPVLRDGDLVVWDSLAIALYLAERHPGLWPADPRLRAEAYAVTAEMHSGFPAMRAALPMDLSCSDPRVPEPAVAAEVARIAAIWSRPEAAGGPFLFGAPSLADCAFAPVASRFRSYGVPLDGRAAAYAETLLSWPPFLDWETAAALETHVIENP